MMDRKEALEFVRLLINHKMHPDMENDLFDYKENEENEKDRVLNGLLDLYKYILGEPAEQEDTNLVEEIKALSPAGMTAEEMYEILLKDYPEIFDYWYTYCNMMYRSKNDSLYCKSDDDRKYWQNDEFNFAKGILYDCGKDFANKVGKILVAATE